MKRRIITSLITITLYLFLMSASVALLTGQTFSVMNYSAASGIETFSIAEHYLNNWIYSSYLNKFKANINPPPKSKEVTEIQPFSVPNAGVEPEDELQTEQGLDAEQEVITDTDKLKQISQPKSAKPQQNTAPLSKTKPPTKSQTQPIVKPESKPVPKQQDNSYSGNSQLSTQQMEMLDLINRERINAGLTPLSSDAPLANVATIKAKDMVTYAYFSHDSPTYGSPFDMMKRYGITYNSAGENLSGNQSVQKAHERLMASPGHKANILNPGFTHVGIGIEVSPLYGYVYVQMFIGK